MRIGYVQFGPVFGDPKANVERARSLIRKAEADLLVLPELFNTGYHFLSRAEADALAEPVPDGPTTAALAALAAEKKMFLVAGIAERSGGKTYNSSVVLGPSGFLAAYRKAHLFNDEKSWFEPGGAPCPVVPAGPARLGILICFDYFFPEVARSLALEGAEILCHPSNLVLAYGQTLMRARSVENRVFSITANRTGNEERGGVAMTFTGRSQIVGPAGEILAASGPDAEEARIVEADPARARLKNISPRNDLFADRRPGLYGRSAK